MSLTISNVLKLGRFNECEVVAGHQGVGRIVENVTVMEVPEIVPWLKGKELLLTTLYVIKDDLDAQNVLVQKLHNAGVSGLAIKPSHFIGEIPEGIINSGNKLGFPIIKIPYDIRYLDILSPVMHHIFNQKIVLEEDLEQATNILQEISLDGQGVDVFLQNVSKLTQNLVTIESELSYIQVPNLSKNISPLTEEQISELSIIKRSIKFKRKMNNDLVPCIVSPIMMEGKYYGNLTCWEVNSDHLSTDIVIIEKASTLLSLEFLRQKVKYDVEQQYKNDFIRELLFSDNMKEKNMIEWGRKYQITKEKQYFCMLLKIKDKECETNEQQKWKDPKIMMTITSLLSNMLAGYVNNGICMIVPITADSEDINEKIYREVNKYIGTGLEVILGIGRVGKGPRGIQQSYRQAEQALYLYENTRLNKGMIHYNDLGAYRLINQIKDSQELYEFYHETVGKLIEYDSKSELLTTLQCYFDNNEKPKVVADSLFIHVNTLKYRIKKIEEITGCDLRKSDGKLNLFMGLKIHNLRYLGK